MDVLFIILIAISALATSGLANFFADKLPNLPKQLGIVLLLFLGAFGIGFFFLLVWILEWINF